MGGIFNKPKVKTVKAPPVPDPAPIPTVSDEADEATIEQQKKKSGFSKTFLTGALTPKSVTKKKIFG